MDGGGRKARNTNSQLETHILTQKDISWELSWTVVGVRLSVSIFTFKKTTDLPKRTFQIG
jgi:hypothetical protein